MDPLSPVDLDDATFILTRPFDLQNITATTTDGFPGLGLHYHSLQAPFDALSVSAIPSSLPPLLYNPSTQPLLTASDMTSSTFTALCPWSNSTSPTPSLSSSPFHLTSSSSQPPPTLSTESLSSTLSHASSRSHCPFSMTNEDTQNQLWPSRTPVPSHETKSSSSQSSISSSPMSQSSSLSSSSSSSSLTCSVCHKKYANNSTLRRHQKIHVYAKNESRASLTSRLPPLLPPGASSSLTIPFATTSSTTSSAPIAPLLGRLVLPTDTSGVSTTERHTVQGYSPGSDPDIKKPECVGCGKAFARRDTVILHIKNQKRHWDEFVAMREQWICEKKSSLSFSSSYSSSGVPSTNLSVGLSMPIEVSSGTREAKKGGRGGRGSRPRRKAVDRYRRAEKLWHSTQQGRIHRRLRKCALGSSLRTRCGSRSVLGAEENDDIFEFELDDVDAISLEDEWEEEDDEDEDVEERDEEGDAKMYDIELVANMDAPQKFERIMRAMKMPPCWKERKVRLFGAFGMLEESVLQ